MSTGSRGNAVRTSRADLALSALLLAITVLLLVQTTAMGRVARRVPEPVVLITLGLLMLQVLAGLFPAVARVARAYSTQYAIPGMVVTGEEVGVRLEEAATSGEEAAARGEEAAARPPGGREIMSAVLWVAVLPVLVATAGLVPSTFFYALIYFRFPGEMRWVAALTAAVGLSAGLYVLLGPILGVTLRLFPWA